MNKKYHFGVITSFIYTTCYVAENRKIIEMKIFENIYFNAKITATLDNFFQKYQDPLFLTVFTGPAPLLSCRTTLIFFQGWTLTTKISLISVSGMYYYSYSDFDSIFIQNFSGKYFLLETNQKIESINLENIKRENFITKKVGLVARKEHSIPLDHTFILQPNIEKILETAVKKYIKNDYVRDMQKLKPYQ